VPFVPFTGFLQSDLIFWSFGLLSIVFLLSHSAKVVAELAKAPEIQAAVMSHPSLVTVDDIKGLSSVLQSLGQAMLFLCCSITSVPYCVIFIYIMSEVRCPISVLGAEIDQFSPPELVKQFEQVLSANSAVSIIFGNLIYDPRVDKF
jgi:hypothetical protein